MAINSIWCINPIGTSTGTRQRSMIGLFVDLDYDSLNVQDYYRRYLDDPINVSIPVPVSPAAGTETDETRYLRRYLGDVILE